MPGPKPTPLIDRFWEHVTVGNPDECWEWQGLRNDCGYGTLVSRKRSIRAHRVSFELWVGPIGQGLCVLHACDNPPCVNPWHLWLGTKHDNTHDAISKGRLVSGSRTHNAKLNEDVVAEMRALYATGTVTYTQLAETYGVSQSVSSRAVRGITWVHVPFPAELVSVDGWRRIGKAWT